MSHEHSPKPGVTWGDVVLNRAEQVVPDTTDWADHRTQAPRPNRAARRAAARANRKASR